MNGLSFDPRTRTAGSGLSIGTVGLASRGFDEPGAAAETVARVLAHEPGARALAGLRTHIAAPTGHQSEADCVQRPGPRGPSPAERGGDVVRPTGNRLPPPSQRHGR
ncbi:hypothetical protein ACF08M_39895 [Streptomyces sp. NPDC015032]|uniref:hypothetical protein n=1 Tax=Streptomyces sp. NPDC015032 TaxID=3364937 RepID=UPI0036F5391A